VLCDPVIVFLFFKINEKVAELCSGNIDQGQYCEKIKGIVEFMGMRLLPEELSAIWKMQVNFLRTRLCIFKPIIHCVLSRF
jgi:hypothetical protein